jgi:hypothetical protein
MSDETKTEADAKADRRKKQDDAFLAYLEAKRLADIHQGMATNAYWAWIATMGWGHFPSEGLLP